MPVRLWLCAVLAVTILCLTPPPAEAGQAAQLDDGTSIEILGVGPMHFAQGSTSLMMKYRTALPLDDREALGREAGSVWNRFVIDAEKGNYTSAILSAESKPEGFVVTRSQSYNFVFEKKNGAWHTTEDKTRVRLDKAFVETFMKRMDWFYEHNELNAFLLYVAPDWTYTDTDAQTRKSQELDRLKFAGMTRAAFAVTKNFRHRREISAIDISADGATATVKSTESEEGTVRDQAHKIAEDSTDILELRDGYMQIKKSSTVSRKE